MIRIIQHGLSARITVCDSIRSTQGRISTGMGVQDREEREGERGSRNAIPTDTVQRLFSDSAGEIRVSSFCWCISDGSRKNCL